MNYFCECNHISCDTPDPACKLSTGYPQAVYKLCGVHHKRFLEKCPQNGRKCRWGMLSFNYKKKGSQEMTELALENVTKTKCVECGDKLTEWENVYCIICEPDTIDLLEEEEF